MEGWRETACVLNSSSTYPNVQPTHVVHDQYKELVWVADTSGRVSSYYGPFLRPYTSFVAHQTRILDIQVTERLIWTISTEGLRSHKRTGLVKGFAPDIVGNCLLVSEGDILVASERRVNRYNADTLRETGTFALDAPEGLSILFLRKCAPNMCLGLSDGSVQVIDPQTFDIVQNIRCHSGQLTDLDCRKNLLMSCGMSTRRYGMVHDQIVYVFDARARKHLPMLSIATGALFVRMHPRSPTNCVVIGPDGQLHFLDTKNPGNIRIQQAAVSSALVGIDMSPQGDSIVILEQTGVIHYWSRAVSEDLNAVPKNLELPTRESTLAPLGPNTPLSAVGMPYYQSELLSSWSAPLVFDVGMPSARDLSSTTSNTATKYVSVLKSNRRSSVSVPRFISERERLGLDGNENENPFENDTSLQEGKIPRLYRLQRIHYSRFGVDDFDFRFYNKSPYSGLENLVSGETYGNALFQLLRWCAPIYNWSLVTFATYNYKPFPVLGELATLFDMLHKANGRQCRTTNFTTMLANKATAVDLGLLDSRIPLSDRLPLLYSFIVEQVMGEQTKYVDGIPTGSLNDILGISVTCRMYGTCGYRTDIVKSQAGLEAVSGDHKGLSAAVSRTTDSWTWCEKCQKHHTMAIVRQVTATSAVVFVSIAKSPPGTPTPLIPPAPLAASFSMMPRADRRSFKIVDSDNPDYVLTGYIAEIVDKTCSHLVAVIMVHGQWHLFNDFLVKPISAEEALDFSHVWKQPLFSMYTRVTATKEFDYTSWQQHLDTRLLYETRVLSGNSDAVSRATPLQPGEIHKGSLVALDAEFVLLGQEVAEIHSDGTKSLVQPSTLSLARVSVIRGSPPHEEVPFIDDFIETRQLVVDYLTLYSGIEEGDLDPEKSPYSLVSQQFATRRLWILLNMGCVFVGHALVNDFRTINLQIPSGQIIDTIELYYDKKLIGPRRLSLKFLVWAVLGEQIQTGNHDSIEDALSALKLYYRYKDLERSGELDSTLKSVYMLGQSTGFKVPTTPDLVTGDSPLRKSLNN